MELLCPTQSSLFIPVHHERMYAENVISKQWLVRSFSSQHHSKFIANIATENVSQVRTEECKTRSFICKVNLNFLRSSTQIDHDRSLCVIVSLG